MQGGTCNLFICSLHRHYVPAAIGVAQWPECQVCPLPAVVGDCLLPKFVICLKEQGARAELCFVPKPAADTRNISTWEGDKLKQLPPGQIPDTVSVTQS